MSYVVQEELRAVEKSRSSSVSLSERFSFIAFFVLFHDFFCAACPLRRLQLRQVFGQEPLYLCCDFGCMSFQREMAGVVEVNNSLRLIPLEGLSARRQEERIVLPPDRQQRRASRT